MYSKIVLFFILSQIPAYFSEKYTDPRYGCIEDLKDRMSLSNLLDRRNVLILFVEAKNKKTQRVMKVVREVGYELRGEAITILLDCSDKDQKPLCKKLKSDPKPYQLKHYQEGEFHKDYDRKITHRSMTTFLRDPTGPKPWEEDKSAADVYHILGEEDFEKCMEKFGKKSSMVMFYMDWCPTCEVMKTIIAAAATELKGQAGLAAIDVNRYQNYEIGKRYGITGLPALVYFRDGQMRHHYNGINTQKAIVRFLRNPNVSPIRVKKRTDWADEDNEIVHLNGDNFEPVLRDVASALVMFYAPWCRHCTEIRPEYEKAGEIMKEKNINGMLAAIDATKEELLSRYFDLKVYPTFKFFSFGRYQFDIDIREADRIAEFMENPYQPPPIFDPEPFWSDEKSDVVHLTGDEFRSVLRRKKHALVAFHEPWCEPCKKLKPEFTAAAEAFKYVGRVSFAAIDCEEHKTICKSYKIKSYPTLKYFQFYKTVKSYDGNQTKDDFVKFMSDLVYADVDHEWISFNKSLSFTHFATGEDMLEAVKTPTPLFVMFYSPLHPHHVPYKPTLVKLIAHFENKTDLAFGVVDCSRNPQIAQQYNISRYPTFKMIMEGKQIAYEGTEDLSDFITFIEIFKVTVEDVREEL